MVNMDLLRPRRPQQLARQPPEDRLAVAGAVGEQRQASYTGQHRIGGGARPGAPAAQIGLEGIRTRARPHMRM